jgi:hypothetical protein
MKKELRPTHEDVSCDICQRTILKGERTEAYLAPGGQRHTVCELCTDRAYNEGWIRESAHGDMPASTRRPQERRSLFGRMKRRRDAAEPMEVPADEYAEHVLPGTNGGEPPAELPVEHYEAAPASDLPPPAPAPAPPRRRDARHVRAVPTNAQVKVERALELFNNSEHVRTIGGISRTLGEPWVSATPLAEAPSEVSITVAWELSWYRYRVDLGDADDPVTLVSKGQELEELDGSMRDWNASALPDGKLAVGVRS